MPELFALLDLGSNAARFVLARINPGVGYRVLQKERIQTRLGDGRAGELPPDAVALTLSAVRGFLERLGTNGAPLRLMAVATAAVRDAPNRDCLLQVLKQRDGAEVRLLSDREEAYLGALATMRHLPMQEGVIGDLGGGSLQLTQVRAGRITSAASVPAGAVRMTRRFLGRDPPTPRAIRALRDEVREHLLGVLPGARPGDELLGLGGTVRALARMHLAGQGGPRRKRHALCLTLADVTALRERIEALPVRKRRRIPGLKAERADIILAGAVTVEEVMRFGGYGTLTVCKGGVRDGILWQYTFNGPETFNGRG
jgi:exopolyphosphatase/guanosine-5'-triphosphate,3'-diphosphate pyrophosphatase